MVSPWQFYWKRPQWQELSDSGQLERVRDSASAVVLHTEVNQPPGKVYLVTATLSRLDAIALKVIRYDNEHPVVLQTRELQWPDEGGNTTNSRSLIPLSALSAAAAHQQHPTDVCSNPAALGLLLTVFKQVFPGPQGMIVQDSSPSALTVASSRHVPPRRQSGLVALSLMRLPPKTIQLQQQASDAMEILNFLSLHQATLQPMVFQEDSDEVTDLVMIVLTRSGKVHIYNLWELLSTISDNSDDLQRSMANLMFGSTFQTLQEKMLPLSQPNHTILLNHYDDARMDLSRPSATDVEVQLCLPALDYICVAGKSSSGSGSSFVSLVSYSWTQKQTLWFDFEIVSMAPIRFMDMRLLAVVGAQSIVCIKLDCQENKLGIVRFQVLPVELPTDVSNVTRIQMAQSEPPSLVFVYEKRNSVILVRHIMEEIVKNEQQTDSLPIISTKYDTMANLPEESFRYGHFGQGWGVVGTKTTVHFCCFDGANSSGAYISKLGDAADTDTVASPVLPVRPFRRETIVADDDCQELEIHQDEQNDQLDSMVVDAMESISNVSFRDRVAKESPNSPKRKSTAFSLREKSRRLMRKVERVRADEFEAQTPILSVSSSRSVILSLREAASMTATPFSQVLHWLSEERRDYFTGASVSLSLLKDPDSLRHLWTQFEKMDDEDELEGLLDGIFPIDFDREDNSLQATKTRLADMTVSCLAKGGFEMASTLEPFLSRDSNYNPSRASLLLVAATANAVSDDPDQVASVMGKDYRSEGFAWDILWPVKCLLAIGSSRKNQLASVLLLLNSTIPDELRRRDRGGVASTSVPSLELCQALVSLIVGSSPEALEGLLDLVDEQSRERYWSSLDHATRLELSLMTVSNKCPLIRDPEVRSWALTELQKTVESEELPTIANVLHSDWLCTLAQACLKNAGCELEGLLEDRIEESKSEDGLKAHTDEVQRTRTALMPSRGSGGLDFDLMIPSLLILERRGLMWHPGSSTSTRAVLNAACYLAGRCNIEAPKFPLDTATLMRQCTFVGNVEAGANLIGGKNGFILECCRILIDEAEMNMDEAESYILSSAIPRANAVRQGSGPFVITAAHRRVLWLLEEHVLRIRTYGEFETVAMRGKVDPVFAATLCFRLWWTITRQHIPEATKWLVQWLREQLSITESSVSPDRLACAALVRALIWPENAEGPSETLLAHRLGISSLFLIELSRSCCGLVQALPSYAIEGKRSSEALRASSPFASPMNRSSDTFDESFVSAAASYQDIMDTSLRSL